VIVLPMTSSVNLQSLDHCIGSKVRLFVTYQPDPIEGEVVAFDQFSQTLILRSESERFEITKSYDYFMIVGSYVKSVECLTIVSQSSHEPLPPVDWDAVESREQANIAKLKQRHGSSNRPGVSERDQELFRVLARVYRSSEWGDKNEMKIDSAIIMPPYGVDDITGPPEVVERIKKVMENARAKQ